MLKQILDIIGMLMLSLILVVHSVNLILYYKLEKKDKRNEPLYCWTHKNKEHIEIINIDSNYRSASYNKINRDAKEQEIIIIPKKVKEL